MPPSPSLLMSICDGIKFVPVIGIPGGFLPEKVRLKITIMVPRTLNAKNKKNIRTKSIKYF
jgi:hypothetical protein